MSIKSLSLPSSFPFPSPTTHSVAQFFPNLSFLQKPPPSKRNLRTHFPRCQAAPPCPSLVSQQQQEQEMEDTLQAISQFLREIGVSPQDSDSIAFKCPNYAKMLVDGVRDLDELSEWNIGREGGAKMDFGDLGFKEKVVFMAKEKGDGGKSAFLESIGLSLSSAMIVARYLSGESLPVLVEKVKYMKEMFFSGSDCNKFVGRNARRMMMHLQIHVDEDLQQTLAFFQKIETRRGGLDLLASADASFHYLVESFPRILVLSVDSHLRPIAELLESIGVPKEQMGNVLLLFPPLLSWKIRYIERRLHAMEKFGAVDKDIGKMLMKYPWILSADIQKNYKEVLSFFEMEKVPKVVVDRAIRSWPHILACSTSKLEVLLKNFSEFGAKKKLDRIIFKCPQLLLRKPEEFLKVVSFLEEIGCDQKMVGRILGRSPEIFAASVEDTLKKKVDFLASIGVPKDSVSHVIRKYPEILMSNVDETILPRMKYLMDMGLSKRDVAIMVRRFPPLLGYSIDKVLSPKYEFLVKTMAKPVKEVVDYPRYFSYSLEEKIKPRFSVLTARNVECSLRTMLEKNDEEFMTEFMDAGAQLVPYSPSHQLNDC